MAEKQFGEQKKRLEVKKRNLTNQLDAVNRDISSKQEALKDMEDQWDELRTELTMADNKIKELDLADSDMHRTLTHIKRE